MNHTDKQAFADKADGDAAEHTKLTQSACYAVQCWAQYSPNSDEYAENYVSAQQTARLAPELQWVQSLSASNGLFHYTLTDQVIDGASSQLDSAKRGAENLADQFAAAVRQTAGRSSSSDIDPLTSAMDSGEPPSRTAGAVVTLPMVTCAPQECVLSPSIALPGTAGYVPGNATFNSGNSDEGDARQANPSKADSPVWQGLDSAGNGVKTDGKLFYEWDYTHNDIEVYNKRGVHLGSMDPVSGDMYKDAVPGRKLNNR